MWVWETTIEGIRPISKKNSPRIFDSGSRKVRLPSVAFETFKRAMTEELKHRIPLSPWCSDFRLHFDLYEKGKLDIDLDNAETSVLDVLADCGVIANDKNMVYHSGGKYRGHKDWRMVIRLSDDLFER